MEKLVFTCTATNNSNFDNLALEFWLDDYKFFDQAITSEIDIIHEFNEDEADHVLKIVLKNKSGEHTTIDSEGNIISDSVISIADICFDGIDVDTIFFENATYNHNFNGSGPDTSEKFYGDLGCNGTITFSFSTPFYVWLLENM